MIYRDPYVWIDPWAEFERFDDYLEREEEEHHNAMRRAYAAMSDERSAMLVQYNTIFQRTMEVSGLYTQAPISIVVPK